MAASSPTFDGLKQAPKPALPPGASPHAPSVALPLRFVVAGLVALGAGVGALVMWPDILATYHYNQRVIAVTHLFVLGWMLTIVMGAMYQLVPVALETQLHSERLARWQFVFHLVGAAGMVWMFWEWNLKQVGHFGSVLGFGVALFVYNIVRTLMRVPRWTVVATAVGCAVGWLGLTVCAGLAIAIGKCTYDSASTLASSNPLWPMVQGLRAIAGVMARFDQLGAMHAHAHLGVLGVFVMMIVGVSYRLVPMFTLSEIQSPKRALLSLVLLNGGLMGAFVTILLRSPLKPLFAGVIVAGLAVYGWEIRAILRARKRRVLDWALRYFLTALVLLAPTAVVALVLAWPSLRLTTLSGQLENWYGFLGLIGVVSFAIIGMLYKIIPFLVWYKAYGRQIGLSKVPALADLYSPALQAIGYWSYLGALALGSAGIVLAHATAVRAAAALLALSFWVLAVNVWRMLHHLIEPRTEPLPARVAPAKSL